MWRNGGKGNMSAFLEDYREFLGTGRRNDDGEDLYEFLEKYDASAYETPSNTVDNVIFSYEDNLEALKVLLIKRKNHPCIGFWALPGGFVEMKENLIDAAARELKEETNVEGIEIEFLGTYGDYDRDPRTRVITSAYISLIKAEDVNVQAGDDAQNAEWFSVGFTASDEYKVIVSGKEYTARDYNLVLTGDKVDVTLAATTRQVWNSKGYIKNKNTEVLLSDGIATDHAAIITDGILRIIDIKNNN